jgi:formate hydrogenlyase subunit 4
MEWTLVAVNGLQAAAVVLLAPLFAGIYARARAWLESRHGPSILQPYYDLAKYLRKETILPRGSSWVFVTAPILSFGTYLVISVIVPIITPYPIPTAPLMDFLGGGLLFGLAGLLTLLAAMDSGSNYTALGASRAVSFAALGEPTLIMVFFAVAVISGTNSPYVTNNLLTANSSWYLAPTHLLAMAAFFLLILAETGKLPVESAGLAELGMIDEGRIFEHSGRLLGILRWNTWLKQFILLSVFVNVFAIPWGMVASMSLVGAVFNIGLLMAKLLLVLAVLVLMESALAKVRLFKIKDFLALSFSLAILSVLAYAVLGVP